MNRLLSADLRGGGRLTLTLLGVGNVTKESTNSSSELGHNCGGGGGGIGRVGGWGWGVGLGGTGDGVWGRDDWGG